MNVTRKRDMRSLLRRRLRSRRERPVSREILIAHIAVADAIAGFGRRNALTASRMRGFPDDPCYVRAYEIQLDLEDQRRERERLARLGVYVKPRHD